MGDSSQADAYLAAAAALPAATPLLIAVSYTLRDISSCRHSIMQQFIAVNADVWVKR